MLTRNAKNNVDLCKGQDKGKILLLWELASISPKIISELAEYYNVENTKDAVAETLSRL